MIKLMIVEDEKLCREGLVAMPWAKIGVSVSAQVEGGVEALDAAKKNCPDIIITDINMPGMNGLDLAKNISVIMPEIKIIFLSACDNFEYAQEAIKYGVCEYILKPFTVKKVIETVEKIAAVIARERERFLSDTQLAEQLESVKPFLKDYFLSYASSETCENHLFGDISINDNYCVVVLSFLGIETQSNIDGYRVFIQLTELLKRYEYNIFPFYNKDSHTFIFTAPSHMSFYSVETAVISTCESIQEYLNYNLNADYTIGVGQVIKGISLLEHSYERARNALKYRFYLGNNNIICINDVEPIKTITDYRTAYMGKFLDCVKICDETGAKTLLASMFRAFKRGHEPIQNIQRACLDLFVQLSLVIVQLELDPNILYNKTDVWTFLQQYHTIDDLEEVVKGITDVTVSQICFTKNSRNEQLIERTKRLISENTALTLNELAHQVYISPCYLSTIFKRETGVNLKEFLTHTRLEKAKKLLRETNNSVSEISEAVGYKNQQYFSTVFSQNAGMTPTAYRNSHR